MQTEGGPRTNRKKPALWNSCRLTFTICVFIGFFLHLCMRLNLSFTIRCMIKRTPRLAGFGPNLTIPVEDIPCARDNIRARAIPLPTEFTWTKYDEGVLISSFFYGYIIGQPIGGLMLQVCGAKLLFILGLISQAVCNLFLPLMARLSFYAIVSTRIIQGLLGGLVMPAAYQMYTVWAHPSERATLMSLAYSGFPVGSVLIFPLASLLCQAGLDNGWPMVFYVIGGVTFVFCIALFWLIYDAADKHPRITPEEYEYLKEAREVKAKKPPIPVTKIMKSIPILAFCIVHFCQSWGFSLIALSIPQLMEEVLYVNIFWNGIYSAAPFIGSLATRLLLSLTYQRIFIKTHLSLTMYRKIFHVTGTVLGAIILLTVCFLRCQNADLIVVLFGFLGAVQDLAFIGSYWTSYLELAPAFAGILSGFTNTLSTLTGIISPNVISSVVKEGTKSEWNHIFYIMIGLCLLSGIVYAIFGSSEPLPWGQFLPVEDERQESK